MKFKRLMLVTLVLLAILTIGAVSASEDINTTETLAVDNVEEVSIDASLGDVSGSGDDAEIVAASGSDVLSNESFSEEDPDIDENGTDYSDEIETSIWDENENGKLYTDYPGSDVVWVDVTNNIDGTFYVLVNSELRGQWTIQHYEGDENVWNYYDWGLKDLAISEAGVYNFTIKLDDEIINSKQVTVYEFNNDTFRAFLNYDTERIELYCPEGSEGTLMVMVENVTADYEYEIVSQNYYNVSDFYGWSFWALKDLGFEHDGVYKVFTMIIRNANNDELLRFEKGFGVMDGDDDDEDDPYKIDVAYEFDVNDPDALIVTLYCPDGEQGFFVFRVLDDDWKEISTYEYPIQASDYDKLITVTASDLRINTTGDYFIEIYRVDDVDVIDVEHLIGDSWTEAVDYTSFRYIAWNTNPQLLLTDPVFAVYCPSASEGNITVTVRKGDDEDAFFTTHKLITEVNDENKLYWTLSELNIDEMGEYFINIYHGEDIIEKGIRIEVVSPISFVEVSYINSTENGNLVEIEIPSDINDANVTFIIGRYIIFTKPLSAFIDGDKEGTDAPYWHYKRDSDWIYTNYKIYVIDNTNIEYPFEGDTYEMTVELNIAGRDLISTTGEVRMVKRNIVGNDNITIEIFEDEYEIDDDEDKMIIINTIQKLQGNFVITVKDKEWTWTSSFDDLEGENGVYCIPPSYFMALGPGNYEITVSYIEDGETVINCTGVISLYIDYGGDDDLYIDLWEGNDGRGTLYTDSEGSVLSINAPRKYEASTFTVYVDGTVVEEWFVEFDGDNEWASNEWGLYGLEISEAGDYNIVVDNDNGDGVKIVLNQTIKVSEFKNDDFRAMILYTTESIKLYCPEGGKGIVTINTFRETEVDVEFVKNVTHEITSEDYGTWIEWALSDLGYEPDGLYRMFYLFIEDNGTEIYRYSASHVGGEEEPEGDGEEIEFKFAGPEEGDITFNKTTTTVAYLYIPPTEEFEDVVATVSVYLNGEFYKSVSTSDFAGKSLDWPNHYPVILNLAQFKDKDVLSYSVDVIEDCVWFMVLEDKETYFLIHDDYDPERFEFDVFLGNLTTGDTNDPELMGPNFNGSFIMVTISDSININQATITISDDDSTILTKSLSDCDRQYDYDSVGLKYTISLEDVIGLLPEGKDFTVAFNSGNISLSQKRIRFADYVYKVIIPEDVLNQFPFEIADDVLSDESDSAITLISNSNRQSIYIDLGAGYFTITVNGTKVAHLGNVSFYTWYLLSNWQETDEDYLEYYAPDEAAFLDFVRSYWGDELELFRLTGSYQGAPEISITLADLGITESGTYNIEIYHYPSIPGGLDDHSSIMYNQEYVAECFYVTETLVISKTIAVEFTEPQEPSNLALTIEVEDIDFGDDAVIVVRTNESFSGDVLIKLAGNQYYAAVTNGSGNITVNNLDASDYTVSAIIEATDIFDAVEANATFRVNKIASTLTISNSEFDYGDSGLVAVAYDGATGVIAKIGDREFGVDGNNIILSGLDAGSYTLTVTTVQDSNHYGVSVTASVTVNKVNASLTVQDIEFDYLSSGSSEITLVGGTIAIADVIVVGHPEAIIKVNSSVITVSGLDAGVHTLMIAVTPDANHYAVTETAEITVNKIDSTIRFTNDIVFDYGASGSTNVAVLNGEIGGYNVINHPEAVVEVNGNVITVSNLSVGTYTLAVATIPYANYNAVSGNVTVTVNKWTTKLTSSKVTTTYGTSKNIVATLKDANGNVISGKKVTVTLNGKTYTKTTDSKGQIKVATPKALAVKSYSATVKFAGDSDYASSSVKVTVVVKKATPKMTAKAKTLRLTDGTKKYTVTLKTDKKAAYKNAKVTVKVNKVTYSAKTNKKGVATFKLTKLTKKGKFTATVKFAGDAKYKAVSKKVKLTVK
jgi:hypothetical protein